MAGQLPALARLGALRHLDLQVVGIHEVLGGHAEPPGGDLLDRRAHRIAVGERDVAHRVLAAFAGVRLSADAVHGDGQRRMRLVRDASERHGAGGESLDQLLRRLHFLDGDRRGRFPDREQAAQRHQPFGLLVDELRVLLEGREVVCASGMLELGDRVRRPHVRFAAHAIGILAARVEMVAIERRIGVGEPVQAHRFAGDLLEPDALDHRGRAREILVDELRVQPDRFEDLRAAIGLVGRNAHLRHHLEQALADRLDVALDDLLLVDLLRQAVLDVEKRGEREIGVDRLRAEAREAGEMVHFARTAGLHDEARAGAQPGAHQVVMDRGSRKQGRDGDEVRADVAVGEDDDVHALLHGVFRVRAHARERGLHAVGAPLGGVAHRQDLAAEVPVRMGGGVAQLGHVLER